MCETADDVRHIVDECNRASVRISRITDQVLVNIGSDKPPMRIVDGLRSIWRGEPAARPTIPQSNPVG